MKLQAPFSIGSRLLPSLKIGDGTLSLELVGCQGNRMVYRWYIDIPAGEFSEADLRSGCQGCTYQEMFGTLLTFLAAAAESLQYQKRTGCESENADLFPIPVVEWASAHSDEISMLQCDIEENADLITD